MRIAVIGVGLIGELHARIFKHNPLCRLVAVCDADAARAEQLAQSLQCRAYSDYRTLLKDEMLDAVSVATPESFRHEPAVAAAGLGLKMLLEKPLGRTLDDVDALIEALGDAGAESAVNFILHAEPRFARMKQIIADGGIGAPVSVSARRVGSRLGIEKYAPWTDLLSSTLIHDIEMTLAVNQAPAERVYAEAVVRACAQYGCHDAVVATIRFTDGAVAIFEASWVLPPTQPEPLDPSFRLIGDGGSVVIEGASHGMKVVGEEGYSQPDLTHWPMLPEGVGGALARSLDIFLARAHANLPPLVGLAEARKAEAVVAAMKRSIKEERPVGMSEFA
ncbi:MAG: Gfo/Idh/MocA family oxidoreductase [Roseitalea sp.]|nr:Gfo/Idh/MocA family oxidoreductase [Roseitalea sp.]MBO6720466.1 Gfo/Idh/MocA family oxidoreductase [Roseitalea sp.]MBO6743613.1 Gfo/Idh/MocA family oxidoreductase [Roseitalea sp.]